MTSAIDVTKPVTGSPTTASVRANFQAAKDEIEALQTDKAPLASPALTGDATAVNLTVSGTLNASGTLQVGGVAVTSTAAELNILDGVTATTAEINYLDGVTSNIQTQLDAKGTSDYSSSNFNTDFAAKSTTDLSEGTNLYYTTTRANSAIDARVDKAFVDGLSINAAQVDGKSVSVVSSLPGSPDANTIYFVTS